VKRPCRRKTVRTTTTTPPTPDVIRRYIQCAADEHQVARQAELTSSAPHWVYLLNLHLRMVELERLEEGVQELL
jgi:hypothetical protein